MYCVNVYLMYYYIEINGLIIKKFGNNCQLLIYKNDIFLSFNVIFFVLFNFYNENILHKLMFVLLIKMLIYKYNFILYINTLNHKPLV